ncbi:hypothetical protein [Sphingobacterium siyangense]|uniref:hypothetical protein n=1 Tax=Sphingobacterium siyangense TaxID=459529 RepID=UPI0028AB6121|nr:hypothetical protein [Sphingobacterium siyangense]
MFTKKYPLTSSGVDEKMYDLYQKDDSQVELEADYVEVNFFDWIINTFILTEDQIIYLHSLGLEFALKNGQVLAYCFRHRLEVTLAKGDLAQRSSKFIRREESVSVTSEPGQDDVVAGGVNYFIS